MTMRSRFGAAAPLALLGTLLLAACETEQASVLDPAGPVIYDFAVGSRAAGLPGGSATREVTRYLSNTASDLGGGADFSNALVGAPPALTSLSVPVAALTTEESYAFTDAGVPGRDGFTGNFTVRVDFLDVTAPAPGVTITTRLTRVDAAGVVQVQSAISGGANRSSASFPGLITYSFANVNLGTWAPGDRLRIDYRFQNLTALPHTARILSSSNASIIQPTRSVTLLASNLRALGGTAQYQFWARGKAATQSDEVHAAYGRIVEFYNKFALDVNGDTIRDPISGDPVLVGDSTTVSDVQVNGYQGTDDTTVTAVRVVLDSIADGSDPVANTAVVVSLESAPATTPSAAQFLWKRTGLAQTPPAPLAAALFFGTYGGSDFVTAGLAGVPSPLDYVFPVLGAGFGGVRGPEISVDFAALSRPPLGFFYRGFLVATDRTALVVDTLRSAWSPDPSISRVNLYDADMNPLLPGVVNREVRQGQVRNCVSGSGVNACQNTLPLTADPPFTNHPTFLLMLDPKGSSGTARWRTSTAAGDLPENAR
jgi:hypothetical protein